MEIAVFSDIHGNHVAFEQCLEFALARDINRFIFLGDYVGEFPYPQKTMKLIYTLKEKNICFFVRGNKENYWINRRHNHNCEWKDGNQTVGAMKYSYDNLAAEDIDFFESLSIAQRIEFGDSSPILACHGSPNRNNEKMLPDDEKTKQIIEKCPYRYILCGHTHLQGALKHDDKVMLNPGSVGVSLKGGGKAQFMILHQDGREWTHGFISMDYDKEKAMKEMEESGLEKVAPYWTLLTKHLMLGGEISHGAVLEKAIKLCHEENEKCNWYDVPEKYWERAVADLEVVC